MYRNKINEATDVRKVGFYGISKFSIIMLCINAFESNITYARSEMVEQKRLGITVTFTCLSHIWKLILKISLDANT